VRKEEGKEMFLFFVSLGMGLGYSPLDVADGTEEGFQWVPSVCVFDFVCEGHVEEMGWEVCEFRVDYVKVLSIFQFEEDMPHCLQVLMFFTLADDWDFICWVLWGFRGGTFIFFYFHQEGAVGLACI